MPFVLTFAVHVAVCVFAGRMFSHPARDTQVLNDAVALRGRRILQALASQQD